MILLKDLDPFSKAGTGYGMSFVFNRGRFRGSDSRSGLLVCEGSELNLFDAHCGLLSEFASWTTEAKAESRADVDICQEVEMNLWIDVILPHQRLVGPKLRDETKEVRRSPLFLIYVLYTAKERPTIEICLLDAL